MARSSRISRPSSRAGLLVAAVVFSGVESSAFAAEPDETLIEINIVSPQRKALAEVPVWVDLWNGTKEGGDAKFDAPASVPLAKGHADNSGHFRLALPNDAALAPAAASNDGWLNFDLRTEVDGAPTFYSFSRKWDGVHWITPDGEPAFKDPTELRAALTRPLGKATDAKRVAGPPCTWNWVKSWTAYDRIGELHAASDVKGTFSYGRTADSDIGVGFKYNNNGWTQSGTAHVGTTSSGESGFSLVSNFHSHIKSQFGHAEYEYRADGACPGTGARYTARRVVPGNWLGGAVTGASFPNWHCNDPDHGGRYPTNFGRGATFARSTGRAVRWSGGVELPIAGLNLSMQSGYSNNVDLKWQMGRSRAVYELCGMDGYPTQSSIIYSS
jgi:hypothetical protein